MNERGQQIVDIGEMTTCIRSIVTTMNKGLGEHSEGIQSVSSNHQEIIDQIREGNQVVLNSLSLIPF